MLEYQIFRYFLVGGLAFVCDLLVLYYVTDFMKLHYLLGAAVGFSIGLIVNYYLSISWVFKYRSCPRQNTEFIVFALIGLVGLAVNELCIWFFTYVIDFYPVISKCFTSIIVFLWNYYSRKLLLFHDRKIQEAVSIKHEEG